MRTVERDPPGFVVRAAVILVLVVSLGTMSGSAEVPGWHLAEWGHETFLEPDDPLARFSHLSIPIGISDYALPVVEWPRAPGSVLDPPIATDGHLARFVAGQDLIVPRAIGEIRAVLDDPEAERDAVRLIESHNFVAAAVLLADTPAGITYWCGDPASPVGFQWFIAIPFPAPCPGDGDVVDLMFMAHPVTTGFSSVSSASWFMVEILPLNMDYSGRFVGLGKSGHVFGMETDPQKPFIADLTEAPDEQGRIHAALQVLVDPIGTTGAMFEWGDALTYSRGIPNRDPTFRLTIEKPFSGLSLGVTLSFAAPRPTVTLDTSVRPGMFGQLEAHVPLANGADVNVVARPIGDGLRIGFEDGPLLPGHRVAHLQLDNIRPGVALRDLELRGSIIKEVPLEDPEVELTFQLVGFPAENVLRLVRPSADSGCEQDITRSIDISKRNAETRGRYRTILVSGYACNFSFDIVGSDLHRAQLITDPSDQWDDNDDHKLVLLGATANVLPTSSLDLSGSNQWLIDLESSLRYEAPAQARWAHRVALSTSNGPLSLGDVAERDGLFVNAYFWNIPDTDLDHDDACYLRHEFDNCA